jgi:hypothetical protein
VGLAGDPAPRPNTTEPNRDVSAIAIPTLLSTELTQLLTTRHCAPAVLAHPYAPEHHIVLTGERYGGSLPWPPKVHHLTGTLMLPPTTTPRGPITWIQPPRQHSLRLTREIDVFGALRTILSNPHSTASISPSCRPPWPGAAGAAAPTRSRLRSRLQQAWTWRR